MSVAVVHRDGESNERLIGRWKKKTQQANVVKSFRKRDRFQRNASETKHKEAAIVREGHRTRKQKNRFYS